MAKKQSSLINMVLTLFVITTVAAVALGFVYYFTQEPIKKVNNDKLSTALGEALPQFDNIIKDTIPIEWDKKIDSIPVFKVSKENIPVGVAVEVVTHKGFSGDVKVLVGFDAEGKIFGYKVLDSKETPGLGEKMKKWFKDPSKEKSYVKDLDLSKYKDGIKVTKDDKEGIDAITAATISSRAFCDALNKAYAAYKASGNTCAQQVEAEPQEVVKEESAEPVESEEAVETAENVEPTNEGGNDNE